MNEQLEKAVTDLIVSSVSELGKAKEFLISELPDVVQQVLAWNFAISLIMMFFWCVFVIIIIVANYYQVKIIKRKFDADEIDSDDLMLITIINGIQALWLIPLIGLFSTDWLKIWIAPKMWLIEYASSLVK